MAKGQSKIASGGFKPIKNARSFSNTGEADAFFGDNLKGVTAKEKEALKKYTGSAFIQLNKSLREGTAYHNPDLIKNMDSGIAKAVLTEPITVHRGSSAELLGFSDKPTLSELKQLVGRSFTDNAYCSTSAKENGGFADFEDIHYEITVPPGKGRGQYIEPISQYKGGDEVEYLLKRGTHFRITDVSGTDKKPVVHMQIVDD